MDPANPSVPAKHWEVASLDKINFQDIQAEHVNRYKFVPVPGTTDEFDVVPVRGTVTNEGTPVRALELNLLQENVEDAFLDVWHKGELKIATGSTSLTPPNRTGTNNSEISTTISLSPWGFTETPKVFVTGLTGSPLNMITSATVSGSGPWNLIIKLTFVSNDPNAQPWEVGIQWMAIGK